MRRIVVIAAGLALFLPGTAGAQPVPQGPAAPGAPEQAAGIGTGQRGGSRAAEEARGALLAPQVAPPAGLAPGAVPPGQRPPRSEKAIGPDLATALFAPIGVIVGPITEGLHAFDAAIAPINEALQPITGPYGDALVVGPDGAPLAPEAVPDAAEPIPTAPAPAPSGRGPRK